MNDISLSGFTLSQFGLTGQTFTGIFDGYGHTINNFSVSKTTFSGATDFAGLFPRNEGTIRNLRVTNANVHFNNSSNRLNNVVNPDYRAGIIAGQNRGMIENCHVEASWVTLRLLTSGAANNTATVHSGGIAGENLSSGTIRYCSVIHGEIYAGSGMENAGNSSTNNANAGGIVGTNAGNILDCTTRLDSESYVSATHNDGLLSSYNPVINLHTGAVVGHNTGSITRCFGQRTINLRARFYRLSRTIFHNPSTNWSGTDESGTNVTRNVGQLIGRHSGGTLMDNYHTGSVPAIGNMTVNPNQTRLVTSLISNNMPLLGYTHTWNNNGDNVPTLRQFVRVSSIGLNRSATTITRGSTETLTATISPSNATDSKRTWSSSNTSVARL
jgi:hypothetical protein